MGTLRGGGMGMSARAERIPHGRGGGAGKADLPKRKPDLKKLWPQVWALVAPRKWLILAGLGLMAINRVAGLVLPFTSKPLLDRVLSPLHPRPDLLPRIIALVFSAMVVQAITSFLTHPVALQGRPAADCGNAPPGAAARGPALRRLLR